jgi:hypothetical protein
MDNNDNKRNLLGDLIITITVGCASLLAFLLLCGMMWVLFIIFATYLKSDI